MKKVFVFFVTLYICFGAVMAYADDTLTGLIPGQIWYSKDPFIEGDTIKIYTAIWNSGKDPILVSVNFYDKNVILGTTEATIPAESAKDVSVFWKVTKGDHAISAKILSSSISSGGKKHAVQLNRSSTEEESFFIATNVKTADGSVVPSTDVAKNQFDKTVGMLPSSVGDPIISTVDAIDSFRDDAHATFKNSADENQKIIDAGNMSASVDKADINANIKAIDDARLVKDELKNSPAKKSPLDAPIPYLKVFLFTSLAMIFGNKFIFYGLSIIILFLIIRFIYRKIRNR